jgi:hypothetical protein
VPRLSGCIALTLVSQGQHHVTLIALVCRFEE